MTPELTYMSPRGRKMCRVCSRLQDQKRRRQARAERDQERREFWRAVWQAEKKRGDFGKYVRTISSTHLRKYAEHVGQIRGRYQRGDKVADIARELGVPPATVSKIARGGAYPDEMYDPGDPRAPVGDRSALRQSLLSALSTHEWRAPSRIINDVREDYGSMHGSQVYRVLGKYKASGIVEHNGERMKPTAGYRLTPKGVELRDAIMGWSDEDEDEDEDEWDDDEAEGMAS
jgi:DNA-binding PadR family transcriptional regulator